MVQQHCTLSSKYSFLNYNDHLSSTRSRKVQRRVPSCSVCTDDLLFSLALLNKEKKLPKEREIQRVYDDFTRQEQENGWTKREKELQGADEAKQRLYTPPRSDVPTFKRCRTQDFSPAEQREERS